MVRPAHGEADEATLTDVRHARVELSAWLRAGRAAVPLTREQVADGANISLRTIVDLEEARWESLPDDPLLWDVLRGYTRCVRLSIGDVFERYRACGGSVSSDGRAEARARVDAMAPAADLRAWADETIARGAERVEQQRERLRAAGLIDEAGRRSVDLPDHMQQSSRTSV